jgi:hypothetical protein
MFAQQQRRRVLALTALCAMGCVRDLPTEPGNGDVNIASFSLAQRVAAPGAALDEPLIVIVTDSRTLRPLPGIQLEWRVAQGKDANLEVIDQRSDERGLSRADLRLGDVPGKYIVEVRLPYSARTRTRFEIEVAILP